MDPLDPSERPDPTFWGLDEPTTNRGEDHPPITSQVVSTRQTPGEALGSVLLPLSPDDVLIPGERVLYRRPKHWAGMVEPIAETTALLVLLGLAATGAPPSLDFIVTVGLLLCGLLLLRWVIDHDWTWGNYALLGTALLLVMTIEPEFETVLLIIAIIAMTALMLTLIRWAFYEERLVTDRRIIETSGLFGSSVASISIGRITDITLLRTTTGEFLDYGELRVETPGQDQALNRIRFLQDPTAFHDAILAHSTG